MPIPSPQNQANQSLLPMLALLPLCQRRLSGSAGIAPDRSGYSTGSVLTDATTVSLAWRTRTGLHAPSSADATNQFLEILKKPSTLWTLRSRFERDEERLHQDFASSFLKVVGINLLRPGAGIHSISNRRFKNLFMAGFPPSNPRSLVESVRNTKRGRLQILFKGTVLHTFTGSTDGA